VDVRELPNNSTMRKILQVLEDVCSNAIVIDKNETWFDSYGAVI